MPSDFMHFYINLYTHMYIYIPLFDNTTARLSARPFGRTVPRLHHYQLRDSLVCAAYAACLMQHIHTCCKYLAQRLHILLLKFSHVQRMYITI